MASLENDWDMSHVHDAKISTTKQAASCRCVGDGGGDGDDAPGTTCGILTVDHGKLAVRLGWIVVACGSLQLVCSKFTVHLRCLHGFVVTGCT